MKRPGHYRHGVADTLGRGVPTWREHVAGLLSGGETMQSCGRCGQWVGSQPFTWAPGRALWQKIGGGPVRWTGIRPDPPAAILLCEPEPERPPAA